METPATPGQSIGPPFHLRAGSQHQSSVTSSGHKSSPAPLAHLHQEDTTAPQGRHHPLEEISPRVKVAEGCSVSPIPSLSSTHCKPRGNSRGGSSALEFGRGLIWFCLNLTPLKARIKQTETLKNLVSCNPAFLSF